MYFVCFLLGNSPTSEFYMPTFRNTLSVPSSHAGRCRQSFYTYLPMKMEGSVPQRRYIKFRHLWITQKKTYNIQNTAKVWNQEFCVFLYEDGEHISGQHYVLTTKYLTILNVSVRKGIWKFNSDEFLSILNTGYLAISATILVILALMFVRRS